MDSKYDYGAAAMGDSSNDYQGYGGESTIYKIAKVVGMILVLIILISGIGYMTGKFDLFKQIGLASGSRVEPSNLQGTVYEKGTVIRQCTLTETMCTGNRNCRGANGQVVGPTAVTPDGKKCCMFACESQGIEVVQQCKSTEKYCAKGQACRMGDTIMMPTSITTAGNSCCRYDCDDGDIPIRAPFSSETVCPVGSYCLDFEGKPTAPKARMENGDVICAYSGENTNPCTKIK